ncbi:unnamed protein product [Periconia digitata]|uniref:Uncharacterized protein n=1 Tax=Periconia digitata TaxID=1303443 RepID=A0A9W4U6K0_9PLEO|nr:unnamed protein product [Periconia digitata]
MYLLHNGTFHLTVRLGIHLTMLGLFCFFPFKRCALTHGCDCLMQEWWCAASSPC